MYNLVAGEIRSFLCLAATGEGDSGMRGASETSGASEHVSNVRAKHSAKHGKREAITQSLSQLSFRQQPIHNTT